eukprot:COSAG06_NODE_1900_length_8109_cov_7.526841_2_plen_71_part_01
MLGKKLGTAAVDAAMKDMDADGNGEVSFPEFKAWWDENGGRCSPQKNERATLRGRDNSITRYTASRRGSAA